MGNITLQWYERDRIKMQLDVSKNEGWISIGWVQCEAPEHIIPTIPTDEQKFNSQLCIDGLFRKFITSLATFSSVSASLIQLLQDKKPDENGSYYNYFWCIRIYLVQVKNKDLITQLDYDRVLSVFMEQNINLENY